MLGDPNVTVCTITYLTSPVHWTFVCDNFVMVMGLYNIIYKSQPNVQGMGLVHEATDTEVCIINNNVM